MCTGRPIRTRRFFHRRIVHSARNCGEPPHNRNEKREDGKERQREQHSEARLLGISVYGKEKCPTLTRNGALEEFVYVQQLRETIAGHIRLCNSTFRLLSRSDGSTGTVQHSNQ